MTLTKQLTEYINAAFAGIWIQTFEPDEAEREIVAMAKELQWDIYRWDIAAGLSEPSKPSKDPNNPLLPLQALPSLVKDNTTCVLLLHNFHRFTNNPMVVQELFNRVIQGKATRCFIIILSPVVQIPIEVEKLFVVLEHPLPTKDDLAVIAEDLTNHVDIKPKHTKECIDAASGLTRYEAEGAFALSLARHADLKPETMWELKASLLKKSGMLEMHRGTEKFTDLGGMQALKDFAKRALTPGRQVRPKGILLLGVPGTGKSAFAKALGNETGRPTLILDVGAMFGSLVGQTEERIRNALKIADAMAPCVLFVDEIEKALAGAGQDHQGDSGVSARLFGTLLSWLNDHTSDVFFIGTCNDISKMPPEFSRAERFDGIFFIDLPSAEEKSLIWQQYTKQFDCTAGFGRQDWNDINWTGAEIKACCRLASLLDVSIRDATENIVPVATTAADKVTALRSWASGRCLSASMNGIYNNHEQTVAKTTPRRALARKD